VSARAQYDFPARFATAPLPSRIGVDDVRALVSGASTQLLSLDRAAVEILGRVAGATLRASQIDALLPSIHEQLSAVPPAPQANSGPLSQTDVLGAILGVAHFLLHTGGDWLFASIPISNRSSPDLYAVRAGGKPWYVELKGIAPLATEVDIGTKLDVCSKVRGRVADGLLQLKHDAHSSLGSSVFVPSAKPVIAEALHGGRALSAVVLPDGFLADRHDLVPVNLHGCPTDRRCAEQCLRAPAGEYRTALVELLWLDESAADSGGDPVLLDALAAMQTLNSALWAGTRTVADDALVALTDRMESTPFESGRTMLEAALAASRGMTSRKARERAARNIGWDERLEREADLGFDERPRLRNLDALYEEDLPRNVEFEVRGEGYSGAACISSGVLRTAPSFELASLATLGGERVRLLDVSARALRDVVVRRLFGGEQRELALEDVRVRGGERQVVVGRELAVPHLPGFFDLPPRARREFTIAWNRGDVHGWTHRWRNELDKCAGIEWCRWADLLESVEPSVDPFFQSLNAWASFDGRLSMPI
jgi:hypothetical protein